MKPSYMIVSRRTGEMVRYLCYDDIDKAVRRCAKLGNLKYAVVRYWE